jgi:anaerobic selenocysteine-containing dehydrogenase
VAPPELAGLLDGSWRRRRSAGELVMTNRRTSRQYNSFAVQPSTPTLYIHPDDAGPRGLADGDEAVIATAIGSCTATVEVTTSTSPGVVSLPHGHGAADVNQLLTTDDVDTLNGMPIMSGFAVTVSAPGRPAPATPARTAGATRGGR